MENKHITDTGEKIIYLPMAQSMEGFQEDDEIDLLELWAVLWRKKWFIMGYTLACTLLLPNKSDAGAPTH
jgi:hypothetical protein